MYNGLKKQKPVISFSDSVRRRSSILQWNLDVATQLVVASDEDGSPALRGVLPDGKVVVVKRLFFNTRQWVDHFFNEVNLISGIPHKNLVELLGCNITGPESLLLYEYVITYLVVLNSLKAKVFQC
ncbi:hypothetical protein F8388_004233 [Cannabis sativa]|uniref:Protein kinase domain-containing protein n=1 Tax=Cannabis sativa TaxID=3483 RepID=A0A7J6F9K8_CANSA|nr:hypothetical protein F8388_004233 [Cannabis sativa]